LTPENQLEQIPTQRDAVFSAMTLDTFNRHPEKVAVSCCAQLINCLNSLYLAHEDHFCVTPVGHVFAMYAPHQGRESVRAAFSAPEIHYDRDGKSASFWGLRGSASLRDKKLILTAVNPDISHSTPAQIAIRAGKPKSVNGIILAAHDIHAHNTFAETNQVTPRAATAQVRQESIYFEFPPASVAALEIELG
jgi:alpha-N-arabinofuranosidase